MLYSILTLLLSAKVFGLNFDWEHDQLTESEALANPAIRFGSLNTTPRDGCRTIPGDSAWPSEGTWRAFNDTLGGVLLQPKPLGSVCYYGPDYDAQRCSQIQQSWTNGILHADDPTSTSSQWASGNTCPPTSFPNSTCTQGGWPVYVVRAHTIRHVQLAVNFARNMNVRLVIKNSGHDFNGKNIGGGALSIWVHHLKGMTYRSNYTSPTGSYGGRAVAYGTGTQSLEGTALMKKENMTMLVAGSPTVGIGGGFLQGGGHSTFTTLYGLAADQVLEMTAVTADGRVVEMHSGLNEDLFWALRGGGGGTFGVLTSVIVKAFPQTPVVSGEIRFSTTTTSNTSISPSTFWTGVKAYWTHAPSIIAANGLGYNFIYPPSSPSGLTFTVRISLPNASLPQYRALIQPLLSDLAALGILIPTPNLQRRFAHTHDSYPSNTHHPLEKKTLGESVGHTLLSSRLFPLSAFTPASINTTSAALRHAVEIGNYTFHGMNYSPPPPSPRPANESEYESAVNPAFRNMALHAQMYASNAHWKSLAPITSHAQLTAQHARLQEYMQGWRDVAGERGGSYVNEGDAQDREWQKGFWGHKYEALRKVKEAWDPEGVFWVVGGVGSEGWEIRGEGMVVQDGRVCRVRRG